MKRVLSLIMATVLSIVAFCMTASAENTVPVRFYVKQTTSNGKELTAEVRVAVFGDTKVNSFGFFVDYDETVLDLKSCDFGGAEGITTKVGGLSIGSQTVDAKPYRLLWTGGVSCAAEGDHLVATLTFDIVSGTVPEGAGITILEDSQNPPISDSNEEITGSVVEGSFEIPQKEILLAVADPLPPVRYGGEIDLSNMKIHVKWLGTEGKTEEIAVTDDMISGFDANKYGAQKVTVAYEGVENSFTVDVAAVPGDTDRSGSVNLNDASAVMKHIAGWETDNEVDLIAADVDGKAGVSLSDVALIMKYVARWDVVLN